MTVHIVFGFVTLGRNDCPYCLALKLPQYIFMGTLPVSFKHIENKT